MPQQADHKAAVNTRPAADHIAGHHIADLDFDRLVVCHKAATDRQAEPPVQQAHAAAPPGFERPTAAVQLGPAAAELVRRPSTAVWWQQAAAAELGLRPSRAVL